jgi:alpha-L-rhamnosidase
MPADGLQYVKATVPSEYGLIKSAWTHDGKQYTFDMTIPANTTANVSVPVTEKSQVSESGKVLIDNGKRKSGNKYVKPLKIENGRAYFEVAAGEYQFTINN